MLRDVHRLFCTIGNAPESGPARALGPGLHDASEGKSPALLLRFCDLTEHAMGNPDQPWLERLEECGSIFQAFACFSETAWIERNPMASRFQALIVAISKLSLTCSSALNSASSAS
jgi:hypothetical protein